MTQTSVSIKRAARGSDDCAAILRECSFDGRFDDFRRALEQYRLAHIKTDPYARHPLKIASQSSGVLGYRSVCGDQDEWNRQSSARWRLWLDALPLDLQLTLLLVEACPRTLNQVPLDRVKWEQRDNILSADKPADVYLRSPLFNGPLMRGTKPGDAWRVKAQGLDHQTQFIAGHLIAWKAWPQLAAWMQNSGLRADATADEFYVHYSTRFSRGAHLAKATPPMPFWMTGVFAGAVEPEFWSIMSGAGGPDVISDGLQAAGWAAGDLENPLSWIEPLGRVDDAAAAQVQRTAARWQQQLLEVTTEPVARAGRRSVRL